MKKRTLVFFIGLAAAFQLTAYGDTYDSLTVNGVPDIGDTFTVTVSVTSDDDIGYMQASLEYDDTVVEFTGGDAVGGGGLITLYMFPIEDRGSLEGTLTFTAVGAGDSSFTLSNGYVFSAEGLVLSEPSASASVHVGGESYEAPDTDEQEDPWTNDPEDTPDDSAEDSPVTQAPEESQPEEEDTEPEPQTPPVVQGYLTDLKCDAGQLVPDFSYDVYEYTVYADSSAETAELTATAAAFSDLVEYSAGGALEVGDNLRTVTVTAEDGTVNVYRVNIIRAEPDEPLSEGSAARKTSAAAERDRYKDILNPALAVVLVTLLVALAIVIMWIKGNVRKNKSGKKKR